MILYLIKKIYMIKIAYDHLILNFTVGFNSNYYSSELTGLPDFKCTLQNSIEWKLYILVVNAFSINSLAVTV